MQKRLKPMTLVAVVFQGLSQLGCRKNLCFIIGTPLPKFLFTADRNSVPQNMLFNERHGLRSGDNSVHGKHASDKPPVLKVRYRKLLDDIAAARGTGTYGKFMAMIAKTKVLVLDDFVICQADARQCSDLLELLEEREGRGSLIITSQYPTKEWHHRFSDVTVADAICDRIAHTTHRIELSGGSLRKSSEIGEKLEAK